MYSKTFFAFIAVGTAGLLLVAFSRLIPPKDTHYELVLTPQQFVHLAREQCARAARPRAGVSLPAPTETLGDGKTYALVNWRPGRDFPDPVSCRFEKGKGVTELKIDGKNFPVETASGEDAENTGEPGTPKHWGHW